MEEVTKMLHTFFTVLHKKRIFLQEPLDEEVLVIYHFTKLMDVERVIQKPKSIDTTNLK